MPDTRPPAPIPDARPQAPDASSLPSEEPAPGPLSNESAPGVPSDNPASGPLSNESTPGVPAPGLPSNNPTRSEPPCAPASSAPPSDPLPAAPLPFTPAKPGLFAGLCLAALAVIGLFSALLHGSFAAVRTADPAAFTAGAPAGFVYEVGCRTDGDLLAFEGWAVVENERIRNSNCRVALWNAQTEQLLVLPSHMVVRDELTARFDQVPDNYLLRLGGFAATVPQSKLEGSADNYEICLIYKANEYNHLVHTGYTVADALAADAALGFETEGGGV